MAMQMYLVHPRGEGGEQDSLAEFVALRHGFILMATSAGSLIVALDEVHFETLRRHPNAAFAGGVTFNPQGEAAAKLQKLMAHNVAQQLAARGQKAAETAWPPGYRPLQWLSRTPDGAETNDAMPTGSHP